MKKKYQVFISSTYKDLIDERAAVTQCLLDMGCIPVGMEQFPASNMSQMEYIKKMLDDCDYYILILAGKYGSSDSDGVGFTEKEYNYAIEKGIPVMSFVIKDVGKLINDKCEVTEEKRKKLEDFKNKVCTGKLVNFYTDIGSLQAAVLTSLYRCFQDFPAVGWIRGDSVEIPNDIETKIEEYMDKHSVSTEDIDALFEDETIILNGGNATGSLYDNNTHASEELASKETISLKGAKVMVEEIAKHLPKIKID